MIPGDDVLADRGFDVAGSVGLMGASVDIPAFMKGHDQLHAIEIEDTKKISMSESSLRG